MSGSTMRYIPHTEADVRAMLAAIGVPSIDALFEAIPAALQLGRPLEVPSEMAEPDLRQHLRELADKNVPMSRAVSFLGGGTYRHYAPVAVSQLLLRGLSGVRRAVRETGEGVQGERQAV